MSLKQNKNFGNPEGFNSLKREKQINTNKRVVEIILNSKHPMYKNQDDIGTIFFCDVQLKEVTTKPFSLPRAKPLNINNYTVPLIGEVVQVTEAFTPSPDLEGNPISTNYYQNCVNVHNNAGSNALPLDISKKKGNNKSKTESDTTTFEFKKEFKTSGSQEVAARMLNQYLLSLGFLGRSDPGAPKYKLIQAANGDFIYRLDEDSEITQRLGNWFKEKKNQQNLNPTEGGTIIQGKSGQRINMLTAGPNGTNSISRNVTDVDGDGNPNIGDRALIISLGEGDTENVTFDACSIYLGENLSLPIDAASTNADSTKSTFEPIKDPLEQIETPPPAPIPQTNPEPSLQVQEISYDAPSATTPIAVKETTPIVAIEDDFSDDEMDDPVFAALAEAQEEGLISFADFENYEIAGTEADLAIETSDGGLEKEPTDIIIDRDGYNATSIIDNMDLNLKDKSYRINNRIEINKDSVTAWNAGNYDKAAFTNKLGAIILLPPPDPNLTMKATEERNIKYLILHCTAGWNYKTAADTMAGSFSPTGRNWEYGGYHWMVDNKGVATRCYPDDVQTNGATAMNPKSIHLNWIGGFNKTWQYRPMTGNPIKATYNDDGEITNAGWVGKKGVAPSLVITEEEAYKRLYGFGSKKLEGWNGGEVATNNGNLISQPQAFTLYKLVKKYIEAYPNIKVIGHNQVAKKNCPLFDVPTFMDLMGLGAHTESGKIRGKYYHPFRNNLTENAKYLADSIL